MPEDTTPVDETQEAPKKKRGRPKKVVEEPKVEAVTTEQFEEVVSVLGKLTEKLDKMEEAATLNQPNLVTGRGPNAPTTHQRANQELMSQTPGPAARDQTDAEVNKERRDAIYARREAGGRTDRAVFPSGTVASVGNRQRRNAGGMQVHNQPR